MSQEKKYRVSILGDAETGRSSIGYRFLDGEYTESYKINQGELRSASVDRGGESVGLRIQFPVSNERFHTSGSLEDAHIQSSHAFILVYDVTNEESFNSITNNWIPRIHRNHREDAKIVLVGSKCDLTSKRAITDVQGQELADRLGAEFIETSAKNGINIDKVFNTIAEQLVPSRQSEGKEDSISSEIRPSMFGRLTSTIGSVFNRGDSTGEVEADKTTKSAISSKPKHHTQDTPAVAVSAPKQKSHEKRPHKETTRGRPSILGSAFSALSTSDETDRKPTAAEKRAQEHADQEALRKEDANWRQSSTGKLVFENEHKGEVGFQGYKETLMQILDKVANSPEITSMGGKKLKGEDIYEDIKKAVRERTPFISEKRNRQWIDRVTLEDIGTSVLNRKPFVPDVYEIVKDAHDKMLSPVPSAPPMSAMQSAPVVEAAIILPQHINFSRMSELPEVQATPIMSLQHMPDNAGMAPIGGWRTAPQQEVPSGQYTQQIEDQREAKSTDGSSKRMMGG